MTERSVYQGIVALFMGVLLTVLLLIAIALPAERTIQEIEKNDLMMSVDSKWGGYDDTRMFMNILYIVCILPSLLGLMIMFYSPIKKQTYDVYREEEEREFG